MMFDIEIQASPRRWIEAGFRVDATSKAEAIARAAFILGLPQDTVRAGGA